MQRVALVSLSFAALVLLVPATAGQDIADQQRVATRLLLKYNIRIRF